MGFYILYYCTGKPNKIVSFFVLFVGCLLAPNKLYILNNLNTLYSNALGETHEMQSSNSVAEQHLSSFLSTTISDLNQQKKMIENEISTLWNKCPDPTL